MVAMLRYCETKFKKMLSRNVIRDFAKSTFLSGDKVGSNSYFSKFYTVSFCLINISIDNIGQMLMIQTIQHRQNKYHQQSLSF